MLISGQTSQTCSLQFRHSAICEQTWAVQAQSGYTSGILSASALCYVPLGKRGGGGGGNVSLFYLENVNKTIVQESVSN